jgi:hypothetical protein
MADEALPVLVHLHLKPATVAASLALVGGSIVLHV